MISSPSAQIRSLSRSLKRTLPLAWTEDQSQVEWSTQVSGVPSSQVNPSPSPRMNKPLPQPASNLASTLVEVGVGVAVDGRAAVGAGAAASGQAAGLQPGAFLGFQRMVIDYEAQFRKSMETAKAGAA